MAYIVPVKTKESDKFYAEDGHLVKMVEHYAQGVHEYEIVHYYDKDGNEIAPRYSTLSIKRELAKIWKWEAAKALLTSSGYWDDYVLANYLSEQDEAFKAACGEMVARGIVTQAELDALLPKCIWSAD